MERGSSTWQKSWETTGSAQSYRPACLCQYNNLFTFCQYINFYICPVQCRSVDQSDRHKRNWHLDLFGTWWFACIDHNLANKQKKPHCGATLRNKLCISICFLLPTIKLFTIKNSGNIVIIKWIDFFAFLMLGTSLTEIRTFVQAASIFSTFSTFFRPRPPAKPRFSGWQSRLGHWNGNF